jgi:Asp-tRNA(Asn)/Glu-tRNA(Gln) amidotransferase A subunit family amidase
MSAALVERSASWMARAVRVRQISAVELFEAHAERIAERDPEINALVLPRLDEAREEAVAADAAPAEERGPLHGVPFTCKDPFAVAGMRAPNGSKLLADLVSDADCAPVAAMRAAGAILLGKTNVSEFASWWDSVNPLFGATANPHDRSRTAGGSSGGEAAAIASGMSPLGLGSDLGGSIRNPCHFTGLFGLKAGRESLPFVEHAPLPAGPGIRSFGVIGPMARTVADLELALDVLAIRPLGAAERPARIAVFEEDGLQPVSRACRAAVRRAAEALAGHELVEAAPPNPGEVRAAMDIVIGAEMASTMPAFVGDRFGELSPYLQEMFSEGSGSPPGFPQYLDASARLARYENEADAWFRRHPVALCPCAPDIAPPLRGRWPAELDGVPMRPGGKLTLATYANALGLPAVCVPVMRAPPLGTKVPGLAPSAGLPVGVQLIGARGSERSLLALAAELESSLGGWLRPPD